MQRDRQRCTKNDRLFRWWLDYYTKTVFEFVNEDGFTLCGGGRYDNLVHEIDGKVSMPSVGFGMGVERILYFLEEEKVDLPCTRDIDLYVGILGQEAMSCFWLPSM